MLLILGFWLFTSWLGGVVCSLIALLFAGVPIVNWLNKKKKQAVEKAKEMEQRLHNHLHNQNRP